MMKFHTYGNCMAFFDLTQTEEHHRQTLEHTQFKMHEVQIGDHLARVVIGLGGDIFLFTTDLSQYSKPFAYELFRDGTAHADEHCAPLTERCEALLTEAVSKGYVPIELLMCIHEFRTDMNRVEEDDFDRIYTDELASLQRMVAYLV